MECLDGRSLPAACALRKALGRGWHCPLPACPRRSLPRPAFKQALCENVPTKLLMFSFPNELRPSGTASAQINAWVVRYHQSLALPHVAALSEPSAPLQPASGKSRTQTWPQLTAALRLLPPFGLCLFISLPAPFFGSCRVANSSSFSFAALPPGYIE